MEVKREDPKVWERNFGCCDSSPFLSSGFLDPFRSPRLEPIYLTFKQDGKLIGGISGLVDNSTNTIFQNLKTFRGITFYSGPFICDTSLKRETYRGLIEYIQDKGFIKFLNLGYDISMEPFGVKEDFRVHRYEEYVVRLDRDWESINRDISRGIKRKLKKAENASLQFRISRDPDMVDVLRSLLEETARSREKRGFTDFLRDYIPHLDVSVMKRQVSSGIALSGIVSSNDGHIHSAQFFTYKDSRAFAMFIGTSEKGYEIGANAFNFHGTMEYLRSIGVASFNLGGLPKIGKKGLIQFKEGLGARPIASYSMVSPVLVKGPRRWFYDLNHKFKKARVGN